MSTPNNPQPESPQPYNPGPPPPVPVGKDQATAALICGILGIILCGILGLAALVMGNRARKEARESGRPLDGTMNVAWILGIIGTIFLVIQLCAAVLFLAAIAIPNFSSTSDLATEATANANVRTGASTAAAYASANGSLAGFKPSAADGNFEVVAIGPQSVIIRSNVDDVCRQATVTAASGMGPIEDCP